MYFNWLGSLVTLYAFLAIALVIGLGLFISLKCEIETARKLAHQSGKATDELRSTLTTELASVRDTIPPVEIAVPAGGGLNLTRRAAALRMERRGEPVPTIASALRVPQNEIELLLKLNKLACHPEISLHKSNAIA